jgi:hypothetical protein
MMYLRGAAATRKATVEAVEPQPRLRSPPSENGTPGNRSPASRVRLSGDGIEDGALLAALLVAADEDGVLLVWPAEPAVLIRTPQRRAAEVAVDLHVEVLPRGGKV